MPNIATLTSAFARQRLQSDGLSALGLTTLLCAPSWSAAAAAPAFDAAALTLSLSNLRAPFRGIEEWLARGDEFTGADGEPLTGAVAVLRLHPQAALRLERLATARYAVVPAPLVHPVPAAMVVRLAAAVDRTPQRIDAGDLLTDVPAAATLSFHDQRGMIVCPVAVAGMFDDLLAALPGLLDMSAGGAVSDAAGIRSVGALAGGTHVQLVDLHGALFAGTTADLRMQVTTDGGGGTVTVVRDATTGRENLAPGERLQAAASAGARLHWGFATTGVLGQTPLTPPALPASSPQPPFASTAAPSLPRQFFRVFVVEAAWHLLGNRTAATIRSIPGDDQSTPQDLLPPIRDRVAIGYLADGPDVLGAIDQVVARFVAAGSGLVVACSPTFQAVGLPSAPGAAAHWPAFPPGSGAAPFAPGIPSPAVGITAQWLTATSPDVAVTIAANAAPPGAHIRVYPRQFVEIASIGPEPSFVRGDGGAAIADGTTPTSIQVANPFGMAAGDPQPPGATLVMDLVVTPRDESAGGRRLYGGISAPVAAAPATAPGGTFGGTDRLGAVPDNMRGIAEVPLFGLARTAGAGGGSPGTVVDLVRLLASESTPRTGPRLPTQARFETVVATGLADPAATNGASAWQAVCTGARWMPESRSARHGDGNPGNPAGPDVHTSGVSVNNQLAYDLAWHALRRARPALPFPGSPGGLDGWLLFAAGNNFNEPAAPNSDTGAGGAQTGVGAVLQTVAAVSETPELSLAPESTFTPPTTLQSIINDLAGRIGITPPTVTAANADRQIAQVRREYFVARNGRRDALWSLRRAFEEARELVYIEGAQFARTADSASASARAIDLVQVLLDRMAAQRTLRVIVAVPRGTDFALRFGGWVRQALQARRDAANAFTTTAVRRDRFALFHPVGFPGRSAQIRGSVVVVDDVYALVGSSHLRRRGMTFDGAADVASFDRTIEQGYCRGVRVFRRALMARRLGVRIATGPADASAEWVRLERPRPAFALVRDMLAQGGLGAIQPLWPGPTDTTVLPQSFDIADPDGGPDVPFLSLFASLLSPDA